MRREDVRGVEFDFLVKDRNGHVALFSTAGSGDIPEEVLANPSPEPEASLIAAFQASGRAIPDGKGPGSCKEWLELGSLGFFVFDWNFSSGSYERVIVPSAPETIQNFTPELRQLVRVECSLCFSNVRFVELTRKEP